ncbi:hypothetical protein FA893_08015 [Photobacterium damselae subsp. piscicida]|nr:hypothetical protein E4T25_10490 [Photobacterium damselae subsp. piscicida]TJZ93199.1 hypothetical protein FA893_08015 [Photobacterium damselae subsp. piscicida]
MLPLINQLESPPNFDIDDVHNKIPALLLQPLVENAILHGIQPSAKPGQVSILVKRLLTDEVQVTIEDTGVGIKPEVITKLRNGNMESHRIGLQNVHQRLLLLYGEGLEIVSDKHGTKMSFIIH